MGNAQRDDLGGFRADLKWWLALFLGFCGRSLESRINDSAASLSIYHS